jgi:hypothetical protein
MNNVSAVRMTYASIGMVVLIANFLAGFENVSWLHWLPPTLLPLAAISNICPFQIFWEKIGFAKVTCENKQ